MLNLIKSGLAKPDFLVNYKYKEKFIELWKGRKIKKEGKKVIYNREVIEEIKNRD